MRLSFFFLWVTLLGNEWQTSLAIAQNHMNFNMCMANKTLSVDIIASMENDTSCRCIAGYTTDPNIRDDYIFAQGLGAYKLHTNAKSWNEARKICNEERAHLAVINSLAEESVLLDMLRRYGGLIRHASIHEEAFIGAHDLFSEGEWVTIFGESLYASGYSRWATQWYGAQPDNFGNNQNCAALVVKGGMDDVNCQEKFAFFCELHLTCS